MEKQHRTIRTGSHQKRLCRKCKLVMICGEENRCMLTTGFNLCQGLPICRRKISELSTGAQHIASATLADEDVDSCIAHDRLKRQNIPVGRPTKGTARKRVERNQIDL